MHLGFVVYGPLDDRSGGYRYDLELVRRFREAGDEVTVVSLPERAYWARLGDNATALRRLRKLDVDVLLQDELCHPSLAAANAGLDDDTPLVSVVHHLNSRENFHPWRRRLRQLVEARYLDSVDAFVFNSETTRESVADLTTTEPSVVAYPAGDRFSEFGAPVTPEAIGERATDGPLQVVTVGNLEPRKNVDGLLRGLSRVRWEWELTVVGAAVDARYERRLRTLVSDLGIEDYVTFTGRLPDADLAATLRESHVFALPSHYEGFGIAALEAMGFGLPAIVSTAGGGSELVTHREDGYLVDPTDPSEITDAIAPLCRDSERLVAHSLAARQRYLDHVTWDETAATVREFVRAVAEGTATGSMGATDATATNSTTRSVK
ncbi:group 1 glycosyl transferase [Haloferax elongans ATCC BAA-1513]|uniref:Group 1 glycosyl transferase n=1 Tax=Haloferax elongans ATCC BAA-1513 TaxID=1230453 RepID=M0HMT0_HALEO|nr:glycosyltransferase family 4 protein [Haloferax elongans]ELZ85895.1 group 1 glycosyl transferase [Haloferax elongans ATCC BAA-1513]